MMEIWFEVAKVKKIMVRIKVEILIGIGDLFDYRVRKKIKFKF